MTDDDPKDTAPEADKAKPERDRTVVSVQVSPEDYARLVRHHERMVKATPLQPIVLAFASREAIHRGLDAMDAEVAAAEARAVAAAAEAKAAEVAAEKHAEDAAKKGKKR